MVTKATCPICGTDNVRHGNVAFFERPDGEDQPTHVVAPMPMPLIAFDDNPSARRNAIHIELRCESEREHVWYLDIIQHKGQTFLEARTP